jgi:hypothetical protein
MQRQPFQQLAAARQQEQGVHQPHPVATQRNSQPEKRHVSVERRLSFPVLSSANDYSLHKLRGMGSGQSHTVL